MLYVVVVSISISSYTEQPSVVHLRPRRIYYSGVNTQAPNASAMVYWRRDSFRKCSDVIGKGKDAGGGRGQGHSWVNSGNGLGNKNRNHG
jgi:hypothetical protein